MESLYIQSRTLEAKDLKWIRQLIDAHPDWNRTKLSVHIAQRWQWRNHVGQLKDMACRSMLLKLEEKGLICLLVPWPACCTGPPRGSWQFVTSSSAGLEHSVKPTCAT